MMKMISVGVLTVLVTFLSHRKTIQIFIIGDSTASQKEAKAFPETGWGMELPTFFNKDIVIENHAMNGRSTKSFINEKRWGTVLSKIKAGDFVIIQFGHNDEKIDRPEVGTTLGEYKSNLIRFVSDSRAKKANPILLTPIMRRNFINGQFKDTHQGYPAVVRQVADSLKVPLIDMHKESEKLILGMGELNSTKLFNHVDIGHVNYPEGKKDNTHLSPEGAKIIAKLIAIGIKKSNTTLANKVIGL